jgi:hypothetical protein
LIQFDNITGTPHLEKLEISVVVGHRLLDNSAEHITSIRFNRLHFSFPPADMPTVLE